MKTKLIRLAIGSPLLLAATALLAQDNFANNFSANFADNSSTPTSAVTNDQTRIYARGVEGEQQILPAGLKEKMKLTAEQRTELKPIEDDFAKTSREYQAANQPRIDAANEAGRLARAAKNQAQIQRARTQLQDVWTGLQPDRVAAVTKIKPLLTPDQLTVVEDPKNQWRENHADEADDPSAN
jgi:hypothetical protein